LKTILSNLVALLGLAGVAVTSYMWAHSAQIAWGFM
jgi:hypothetical protein